MIILAVETSCDETSVSIVKDGEEVLTNIVYSQINIHKKFGGVVPEIASRNHVSVITKVFEKALKSANIKVDMIDLVAVTQGPGLIGSLLVGINAASAFAYANNIPLIGVDHILGHFYSAAIDNQIKFPALGLIVSGGHTELVLVKNHLDYKIIGQTLDDAVGEAFDKVARTIGLPYPGGPQIDRLAKIGKPIYDLPRPLLDKDNFDFSFSGLKSSIINLVHNMQQKNLSYKKEDIAKSLQDAILDVIIGKTKKAIEKYKVKQLIVGGGVSANQGLRLRLKNEITNIEVLIPKMKYCTDNAAMIGIAAYYLYNKKGALPNYLLGAYSV